MKINFDSETIVAKTTLMIINKGDKNSRLVLNFRKGVIIDSIRLNNNRTKYKWINDHLIITGVDGSELKLEVFYHGKPRNLGLGSFVFSKFNGRKYLYTINEPVYASSWFPCNDFPEDKALTNVTIETPLGYTSVSNGKLVAYKKTEGGSIFTWESKHPIATYLVTIYSGKYSEIMDSVLINNKKLLIENFVFPKDSQFAFEDLKIQKEGLKLFSKMFGEYPFIEEKYGAVEITWPLGGIENQTASGIGQKFFSGENLFRDLFLHELAHQWWGNAVTLSNWNEIWLNEGFAVYSVGLFDEKEFGKRALQAFLFDKKEDFRQSSLEFPGKYALSNLTYFKGAWVLHMLRNEIGDSAFFRTLKAYFKKFKYKNTTTKKFEKLTEKIAGKNLDYFFNQWINKKGIPVFKIIYSSIKSKEKTFVVRLKLLQKGIYNDYKIKLPFKFISKKVEKTFKDTVFVRSKKMQLIKEFPAPIDSVTIDDSDLLIKFTVEK